MTSTPDPAAISRRAALGAAGAGLAAGLGGRIAPGAALAQEATPAAADATTDGLSVEILQIVRGLPGTAGVKLWAPADAGLPAWEVSLNPDEQLFIASAFKVFVLAE
ncbi:MAG: hypothetical protein QM692_24800, partial [Thermomicrobiales bacterium]